MPLSKHPVNVESTVDAALLLVGSVADANYC